jgi:signal transduction histidine kinase
MDLAPSPRSTCIRHQCSPSCGPSPERSLGYGRVWAAVGVFILACLDIRPSDFLRNSALVSAVAFIFYSLLILVLLRKHRKWPGSTRLMLHFLDVVSLATVALLVHESEAALFLLFLFVLVATAQRWGPRQVLWTAGAFAVLLGGELILVISKTPGVNFQEAVRPGAAYASLAGFVVFATGLLWQLTKIDATERWESSARAAQRVRAHVSSDLHDSVIQCLYTLEYRLEKLRCCTPGLSPNFSEDLAQLQSLVHRSDVELRELVEQGRPLDLGPKGFVEYLADLTAEFEQETGISVQFVSDGGQSSPPPVIAGELIRIVQEALVNVKKHSGARNVSIAFGAAQGQWKLLIEDDGRGFDFTGRHCMLDLEAKGQGPYVIRERVSTLGGELEVESTPGRGARLEIALPKDALG